jgi:hypothetical protein
MKLALRFSPSLISNLTQTIFEECDPSLAEASIPAELKILQGLLKNDAGNKKLLSSLAMGYAGYALLFVEKRDNTRASALYLRARDFGLQAAGIDREDLFELNTVDKEKISRALHASTAREVKALFWSATAWNSWIRLNLDKPAALAQMDLAKACVQKVLDIQPGYLYGAPNALMGSLLAARPKILGGDPPEARKFFEKALSESRGKFFLVHYYFAKYYAVRVQDRALFLNLVKQVENSTPELLSDVCLINAVFQRKMLDLKDRIDELFI